MRTTIWRVSLRVLVTAIIGTVFTFTSVNTVSAATPGSGGSGSAWVGAFWRIGGNEAIGFPENDVHWWGPGCLQDYGGGRFTDAALMSPSCDQSRVYPVVGKQWGYVAAVSSGAVGYPLNDSHRWGNGWTQDFGGGTWGWTLLMYGDSVGQSHSVRTGMRDYFISQGGALGWLGYPTSDEYGWNGITRQDFQGGSVVASPSFGIQPLVGWGERSVFRGDGTPAVYVVLGGRSYWVTSPAQLDQCYGGWGAVHVISQSALKVSLSAYPYVGAAPDCVSLREQRAMNWARSMIGNAGYNGWCERFVENAFGTTGRYASAAANLWQKAASGQLHSGDTNVPAGALAFFSPAWQNGNYGHVMLSLGGGVFISSGRVVFVTAINTSWFGPYAGWAWADGSWSGRST